MTDAKNYFALAKPFEQKRIYEGSITGPAADDGHTSFLLSGTRQEDNVQSVVHAVTPTGLVTANVPTPIHDTEFASRISHDFSAANRVSLQYNVSDTITRNQGAGGVVLASAGTNLEQREDDIIFTQRIIVSPTLLNQMQLFFEKDYDPTRSVTTAPKDGRRWQLHRWRRAGRFYPDGKQPQDQRYGEFDAWSPLCLFRCEYPESEPSCLGGS